MATLHDFIPKQDRSFLDWLTLVVNYLKNKFGTWKIPSQGDVSWLFLCSAVIPSAVEESAYCRRCGG
ncbi:MAG: hypothetical protein LBT48_03465 [Prevotellaceae bacterium]|nr:hypothetical protein [Prevotellaceae bacterium]